MKKGRFTIEPWTRMQYTFKREPIPVDNDIDLIIHPRQKFAVTASHSREAGGLAKWAF